MGNKNKTINISKGKKLKIYNCKLCNHKWL